MNLIKTGVLFFVGLLFFACSEEIYEYDYLIRNVQIVDVETGQIKSNQFIGINGERITTIHEGPINVADATVIIEGKGKFVIPGLWDMHVHYNWNYDDTTPLLLANGIVGVREMWGDMNTLQKIHQENKAEKILTPEIISAGPIIDGDPPAWSGSATVSNLKEVQAEVQKQIKEGVDFLKVYSLLSRESYFAISQEAKKNKIPFAGHIPETVNAFEAITSGQKSIEHMTNILQSCTEDSAQYLQILEEKGMRSLELRQFITESFDAQIMEDLSHKMAASDTWLCPTLTVLKAFSNLDDSTFTRDPRMEYIPSYIAGGWRASATTPSDYFDVLRKRFKLNQEVLGKMHNVGVKILAGTDFPNPFCFPGFSLHDELELLTESGLSPLEALQTATINPAKYLNLELDYGNITPGKIASIILLEANPLEKISNTKEIHTVFLKGRYLKSTQLDSLLNSAIIQAQKMAISNWFYKEIEKNGMEQTIQQFKNMERAEFEKHDTRAVNFEAMGYNFLDEKKATEAIAIFQLFTELYPDSFIAFDGLAQAYLLTNDKNAAIKNFKQSLQLNPDNQNAISELEKLSEDN